MSSNSFAVAGYVSRKPSAKSANTRPSSSSSETASARISRSVKSLNFLAMPTSVLFLDSVSRCWACFGLNCLNTLVAVFPANWRGGTAYPATLALGFLAWFAHNSCAQWIPRRLIPCNHHKTLQHFSRTTSRASGDGLALTPAGSRGNSASAHYHLPLPNSPLNARSTFTSRCINVDLWIFKWYLQSESGERQQSVWGEHAKAESRSSVRQSVGGAV